MKLLPILLAFVGYVRAAQNPAVLIQANQQAFDYAKGIGVQVMNNHLPGLHIPDVSGRRRTSAKDLFTYKLTDIILQKFNAPASGAQTSLQAPTTITLKLTSMSAYVTANYEVKIGSGWFSVTKHGSITASTSGAYLTQGLAITQGGGKPQLNTGSCSADIGKLDVTFHGDMIDSILNIFSDEISDYIGDELNGILCNEISDLVKQQANPYLAQIPTSVEITNGFYIDYSLTSDPTVTSSIATVPMLGEVWYSGHHNDAQIPSAAAMSAVTSTNNKMFCMQLEAEAIIGSTGYAAQVSNLMTLNVDAQVLIDAGLPIDYLQCSCPATGQCMGGFIPQIKNACTNGTVDIILTETAPATATVNSQGAFINLAGDMIFKGNNADGTTVSLFTSSVTASAAIPSSVKFEGWKIKGEIHVTGATLSIKSSNIGTIDEAGLEQLWQIMLLAVVEGELNKVTQAGIQLPDIPDFTVQNPTLAFGDKTLTVCFNGVYTGPTAHH